MEVIYVNKSNRHTFLAENEPCVIALGFFDGVHLGHHSSIVASLSFHIQKVRVFYF